MIQLIFVVEIAILIFLVLTLIIAVLIIGGIIMDALNNLTTAVQSFKDFVDNYTPIVPVNNDAAVQAQADIVNNTVAELKTKLGQ